MIDKPDDAPLLVVHPDDFDLPWVKAEAARRGVDVVASNRVPRGQGLMVAASARSWPITTNPA